MNEGPSDKLRVEYVKSNFFRVVRADGAVGGPSPRLDLFVTFYSERFPIPKILVYENTPTGAPGKEIFSERESKEGVIREAEIGITMDLPTAKSFATWLNQKVQELEDMRKRILPSQPIDEVNK